MIQETLVASPDLLLPAHLSSLCNRLSFFFYNVHGKVYAGCIADGCAYSEAVRSNRGECTNGLIVQSSRNEDLNVLEPSRVKLPTNFLDYLRKVASPRTGSVQPYPVQRLPQGFSSHYCLRLLVAIGVH